MSKSILILCSSHIVNLFSPLQIVCFHTDVCLAALKMSGLRSRLKWRRLLVVAAHCELRSRLMTLQNSPELLPLFVNKQEVKTCHLTWFSIGKSSTWLIIIFLLITLWFSYTVRFILGSLNSSHSRIVEIYHLRNNLKYSSVILQSNTSKVFKN